MSFCPKCGEYMAHGTCGPCTRAPPRPADNADKDIFAAIGDGDVPRLTRIVENFPESLTWLRPGTGPGVREVPLVTACLRSQTAAARALLSLGANPLDRHWPSRDTCLHIAARQGVKALTLLFRDNPQLRHPINRNGEYPWDVCSPVMRQFLLSWDMDDHPGTGTGHFADLPEEILQRIFLHLMPNTLLHLSEVCRSWYAALRSENLWRKVGLYYPRDLSPQFQPKSPREAVYGRHLGVQAELNQTLSLLLTTGFFSVLYSEADLAQSVGRHPEVVATIAKIRAAPTKWKSILSDPEQIELRKVLRRCLPAEALDAEWKDIPHP